MAGNTLTNILPKILARGLLSFREQVTMARVVNRDYGAEAKKKGSTIDIPISVAQAVTDVTPAPTKPSFVDTAPGVVQITLANWRQTSFNLKDDEMVKIDKSAHFLPMQVHEAIRALAGDINDKLWLEYKGVYNHSGVAGTTPFASTAVELVNARKVLNKSQVPKASRRFVMDYDAEAKALLLSTFADAEKTADGGVVKIEGELGRKYGFDNFTDDAVASHTTAMATAGTLAVDDAAAPSTGNTLHMDGFSVKAEAGDLFTIAGNTQQYAIVSSTALVSTDGDVVFEPELDWAPADDAVVTIVASHVVNLAFHREAFAFANRPLLENTVAMALGSRIISATDPDTGISLRLEVSRAHKAIVWEWDVLYGTGLPRPYAATRVLG
jgi:hypothetical protein